LSARLSIISPASGLVPGATGRRVYKLAGLCRRANQESQRTIRALGSCRSLTIAIIGKYSTVPVIRRPSVPRDRRQAGLSRRSGSDPAEERGRRGATIGAGVTRRRGFLDLLARAQIMQCGACVIHRAAQGALDCSDALRVQALLRLDRTEIHERVTDFLFLLGRHPATSITTVPSNQIPTAFGAAPQSSSLGIVRTSEGGFSSAYFTRHGTLRRRARSRSGHDGTSNKPAATKCSKVD
jgi:hypothetical protein